VAPDEIRVEAHEVAALDHVSRRTRCTRGSCAGPPRGAGFPSIRRRARRWRDSTDHSACSVMPGRCAACILERPSSQARIASHIALISSADLIARANRAGRDRRRGSCPRLRAPRLLPCPGGRRRCDLASHPCAHARARRSRPRTTSPIRRPRGPAAM
jgi:hypothetical protein